MALALGDGASRLLTDGGGAEERTDLLAVLGGGFRGPVAIAAQSRSRRSGPMASIATVDAIVESF